MNMGTNDLSLSQYGIKNQCDIVFRSPVQVFKTAYGICAYKKLGLCLQPYSWTFIHIAKYL